VARHRGAVHQIERVPPVVWRGAKARAALEGRSLRSVMLDLLEVYAAGTPTPTPEPIAPTEAMLTSQPVVAMVERRPSVNPLEAEVGF
jgi:hypothetical protein